MAYKKGGVSRPQCWVHDDRNAAEIPSTIGFPPALRSLKYLEMIVSVMPPL